MIAQGMLSKQTFFGVKLFHRFHFVNYSFLWSSYKFIFIHSKLHFMPSKGEDYVFIVMNSVFPTEGSKFISERFDLKGSTVGR